MDTGFERLLHISTAPNTNTTEIYMKKKQKECRFTKKFTSTKDNLLAGSNTVQKAISSKGAVPVLTGIYLKTEGNRLFFAATDLEIGITCTQPVQVLEEGHAVIPAHFFAEIVRRLPNTNLLFSYDEETVSMKIEYDQAETNIKCWRGEEFPGVASLEEGHMITVNPLVFKSMVKQTGFCANMNDPRPIFTGALLEAENNNMIMVGTDSHRLAVKRCKIDNLTNENFKVIVPVKSLNEISRILKEDAEDVLTIRSNGRQISFESNDVRLVSRLVEGSFPNYRQVIPEDYQLLMKAKKKQLQESIERASLFVPERDGSSVLRFNISDSNLNIVSKSEYGMVNENINIYTEGSDLSILFNAKYLLDAFKTMDFDDLDIKMGGPLSPAIFRPLNDESYLYLLLPLRG